MPHVYSLTPLTGRGRNAERRISIQTFEMRRSAFLIGLGGLVGSLPVTLVIASIAGPWALVSAGVGVGVALWLFDSRQKDGLELKRFQAILDSRKSTNGVLYVGAEPIPETPPLIMHEQLTIPVVMREGSFVEAPTIAPTQTRSRRKRASAQERFE